MARSYNALKEQMAASGLRPTNGFLSALLGGPVPLRSPTGAAVGPYDHEIASAAFDLTSKAAVVAPFLHPLLWAEIPEVAVAGGALRAELARDAVAAVRRGRIQEHHAYPKVMGGLDKADTVPLDEGVHIELHKALRAKLRNPGMLNWADEKFPPVGGKGGPTDDWKKFLANPVRRNDALTVLRNITAKVDRKFGTPVSKQLNKDIGPGEGRGRPFAIPLEWHPWRDDQKR